MEQEENDDSWMDDFLRANESIEPSKEELLTVVGDEINKKLIDIMKVYAAPNIKSQIYYEFVKNLLYVDIIGLCNRANIEGGETLTGKKLGHEIIILISMIFKIQPEGFNITFNEDEIYFCSKTSYVKLYICRYINDCLRTAYHTNASQTEILPLISLEIYKLINVSRDIFYGRVLK